jgi:hypothetical protein
VHAGVVQIELAQPRQPRERGQIVHRVLGHPDDGAVRVERGAGELDRAARLTPPIFAGARTAPPDPCGHRPGARQQQTRARPERGHERQQLLDRDAADVGDHGFAS